MKALQKTQLTQKHLHGKTVLRMSDGWPATTALPCRLRCATRCCGWCSTLTASTAGTEISPPWRSNQH